MLGVTVRRAVEAGAVHWETPFNARIPFAPCLPRPDDGKPTFHSQSILCAQHP